MDFQSKMFWLGAALAATGVMAIGGSMLNLDIFFNTPQARPMVEAMGRTGARLFYFVVGVLCLAGGGFMVLQNFGHMIND